MQRTVYYLDEYKILDKIVKSTYPKYELALWCVKITGTLRLVAAPKYTGYKTFNGVNCIKKPIYTFGFYHLMTHNHIKEKFSNIFWYIEGLTSVSCNDVILYFHSNELLNHSLEFFKRMFEETVKINAYDTDDIVEFNDIFTDTVKSAHAFFRVKDGTYESFAVRNLLSVE